MYAPDVAWNTNNRIVNYNIARDSRLRGVMEERRPNVELGYNALLETTTEGTFSSFINPNPSIHRLANESFKLAVRNPMIRQTTWTPQGPQVQAMVGNPIPLTVFNLNSAFNGIQPLRTLVAETMSKIQKELNVPTTQPARLAESKLNDIEKLFQSAIDETKRTVAELNSRTTTSLDELQKKVKSQDELIEILQSPPVPSGFLPDEDDDSGETMASASEGRLRGELQNVIDQIPTYVEKELAKVQATLAASQDKMNESTINLLQAQLQSLKSSLSEDTQRRINASAEASQAVANLSAAAISARIVAAEREIQNFFKTSAQQLTNLTERYEEKLLKMTDSVAQITSKVDNQQAEMSTILSMIKNPTQITKRIDEQAEQADQYAKHITGMQQSVDNEFEKLRAQLKEADDKANAALDALDNMRTDVPIALQQHVSNEAVLPPISVMDDNDDDFLGLPDVKDDKPLPIEIEDDEPKYTPKIEPKPIVIDDDDTSIPLALPAAEAPSTIPKIPQQQQQQALPNLPELPSRRHMKKILAKQLNVFGIHKRLAVLVCALNKWMNDNGQTIMDLTRVMSTYEGILHRAASFNTQQIIDQLQSTQDQANQFCQTINKGLSYSSVANKLKRFDELSTSMSDDEFYQMFHAMREGNNQTTEYLFVQQEGIMRMFNSVTELLNHLSSRIRILQNRGNYKDLIEEYIRNTPNALLRNLDIFEDQLSKLLDNYNQDLHEVVNQLRANKNAGPTVQLQVTTDESERVAPMVGNEISTSNAELGAVPSLQGPEPLAAITHKPTQASILPTLQPPSNKRKRRGDTTTHALSKTSSKPKRSKSGHLEYMRRKKGGCNTCPLGKLKKAMAAQRQNKKRAKVMSIAAGCTKCTKAGCAKCGKGIKGGCNGCKKPATNKVSKQVNDKKKPTNSRIL